MTRRIFKNAMLIAAVIALCSTALDAKIKGLPSIKTYKDFSLKKNNVVSIKYMIYAPKNDSDKPEKGEPADFGIEAFFDEKGNRIKEIVYHIETGEQESITNWVYDEKQGTVVEVRTNPKGEMTYRIEYLVNYKAGTVLARKFENIQNKGEIVGIMMMYEELWSENTKNKTLTQKKTYYMLSNGEHIASRQSIKEFDLAKPNTLYTMMEEFSGQVDCPWMIDYDARLLKTTNGKSKKEAIYNGERIEYSAKSGLLSRIATFGKDKVLKNEVNYSYVFDKGKNWTEALQKDNNKLRFIVERTIKYNK